MTGARMRLPRRPKGDWTPAHLTRRDCTVLVAAICVIALLRAGDYLTGMDAYPQEKNMPPLPVALALSDVFPLWAWGLAIVIGVGVLSLGALFRRHVAVYLGHGLLMATYLTLFVGTLIPLMSRPWWDGYRGATALLAPVVIHFMFWLRTGPRPLRAGETVPTETVRGPQ